MIVYINCQTTILSITIATTNILFGGFPVPFGQWGVFVWVGIHAVMTWLKSSLVFRLLHLKQSHVSVSTLVDARHPDILIVNEVFPLLNRPIVEYLTATYTTVVKSSGERFATDMVSSTVVATSFEAEPFTISIPGKTHGGAAGIIIHEKNLAVVGVHLAALDVAERARQIRWLTDEIMLLQKKGLDVVVGGDFNAGHDEIMGADPRIEKTGLRDCSEPSFPRTDLLNNIQYFWWWPLRKRYKFTRDQWSIDHIFLPGSWRVTSVNSVRTPSDHQALVVSVVT